MGARLLMWVMNRNALWGITVAGNGRIGFRGENAAVGWPGGHDDHPAGADWPAEALDAFTAHEQPLGTSGWNALASSTTCNGIEVEPHRQRVPLPFRHDYLQQVRRSGLVQNAIFR